MFPGATLFGVHDCLKFVGCHGLYWATTFEGLTPYVENNFGGVHFPLPPKANISETSKGAISWCGVSGPSVAPLPTNDRGMRSLSSCHRKSRHRPQLGRKFVIPVRFKSRALGDLDRIIQGQKGWSDRSQNQCPGGQRNAERNGNWEMSPMLTFFLGVWQGNNQQLLVRFHGLAARPRPLARIYYSMSLMYSKGRRIGR